MTGAHPTGPVDPGLQAERTSMAWTRTALAVAAGSLVAARVLPTRVGEGILVPVLLTLASSLLMTRWSHRRYGFVSGELARGGLRAPISNGAAPGLLALLASSIGAASLFVTLFT